ncbi:MAG: transposon-transfer assisting family protein [Clostridia bacterium]|nr:transposon-transfer assisting family protein [Clostridia bacterium]
MEFTRDEINLMCIYGSDSREELICTLLEMRKCLTPEENELRELTDSTISKLQKLSDTAFAGLDLFPDFTEQEDTDAGE